MVNWQDDGSVSSGGPPSSTTITNGPDWAVIQILPNSNYCWTPSEELEQHEIWAHSAIVDSAPVCLKRPLPGFAYTKVTWTFIEKTCEVSDLITGNPRQTRAPPRARVA
jgi:hypothetical protein